MELYRERYVCSGGESFDSVAFDVYGDEKYAAELLCANPELCHLVRFAGGERLYMPVIEVPADEEAALPEVAPWEE